MEGRAGLPQTRRDPGTPGAGRVRQHDPARGKRAGLRAPGPADPCGAVLGLPHPRPGVYYIVSALVLAQVPNRADVFAPGPALRDADGRVVGCVGLSGTPAFAAQRPTPPEDWPGGDWESGDADRRTDDPAGDAPVCPKCEGTGLYVSGPYAGVHCSCATGVARWRIENDVDGSGARAARAARIEALRARGHSESRIDYEMRLRDDAAYRSARARED